MLLCIPHQHHSQKKVWTHARQNTPSLLILYLPATSLQKKNSVSRPSLPTYFEMGTAEEERRKKNEEEGFFWGRDFFPFLSLYLPSSPPRPLSTSLKLRRRITCWGRECPKDLLSVAVGPKGTGGVGGSRTRGTGFFDTDLGATLFDGERKVDT